MNDNKTQNIFNLTDKQIEALSFEESLSLLEKIVNNMEQGSSKLDQSIKEYSLGIKLQKNCQKHLNNAKLKLDKLQLDDNQLDSLDF